MKKVFVSGCFDLLHSGHIAFFEEAATHGEVYVGIGSDKTIQELKGRSTVFTEQERLYMVKTLKPVKDAWINKGSGILDFYDDLMRIKPDILFVNEDGNSPDKVSLCKELGLEYIISRRIPHQNLPSRSTTALRTECHIPFRIDLAGGWLDQPYVSKFYPGAVITISIEPDYDFNDRSGMSTSTRKKAIELWKNIIPPGEREQLARVLFCYENPPGSNYISGSQDALGIVMPGLNYLWYNSNEYWPSKIQRQLQTDILNWLEARICLFPLKPRENDFSVITNTNINLRDAMNLSGAAEQLWKAANAMDSGAFGKAMVKSFNAQVAMFPDMSNPGIEAVISQLPSDILGYKLSGAGGGGYLVLFSEVEIPDTLKIRIRRS